MMGKALLLVAAAAFALPGGQHGKGRKLPLVDFRAFQHEVFEKGCPYAALLLRGATNFSGFGVAVKGHFYVVTTSRLAKRDGEITVYFSENRRVGRPAVLLGTRAQRGIAVVKITDAKFYPDLDQAFAEARDSRPPSAGDCVLSAGHTEQSGEWKLYPGLVLDSGSHPGRFSYVGYVQHSTELPGGAFGGPLLQVELKGGCYVTQPDGSISIGQLGTALPTLAKTYFVGMNVYRLKLVQRKQRTFALPAKEVFAGVKDVLARAAAHVPKPSSTGGTPAAPSKKSKN